VILLVTVAPLSSVITIELGEFGAVLSEVELDEEEPLLPAVDDDPAKVSVGTIIKRRPKVDNINAGL
jgi:hypothetical protein